MSAELELWLREYAEAFDAFDEEGLASRFHCPCLMVGPGHVAELPTPAAIRANVRAILAHHRDRGFGSARIRNLSVDLAGTRIAFATVDWEVVAPDGAPLWEFRNTYNLVRSPEAPGDWKILVSTTHEASR